MKVVHPRTAVSKDPKGGAKSKQGSPMGCTPCPSQKNPHKKRVQK